MMAALWALAALAVGLLGWNLYTRLASDRLDDLTTRRRNDSRLVGRGELVDGNRHLPVALALNDSTFFYENGELQASLDLEWIREVEYSDELVTGASTEGKKVLRLRSSNQTFEFVLPSSAVAGWQEVLPERSLTVAGEGATR